MNPRIKSFSFHFITDFRQTIDYWQNHGCRHKFSPLTTFVADSKGFKIIHSSLTIVHSMVVRLLGGFSSKPSDARTGLSSEAILSNIKYTLFQRVLTA